MNKFRYLIITEFGEACGADALTQSDLEASGDGYIDIYDMAEGKHHIGDRIWTVIETWVE